MLALKNLSCHSLLHYRDECCSKHLQSVSMFLDLLQRRKPEHQTLTLMNKHAAELCVCGILCQFRKKRKKKIPVFTLQQEEVLSEAFSKVSTANIESTARKSVLVFV